MTTADHHVLDPLLGSDDATLLKLRARLGIAADRAGLLDIAYTTMDSPVGRLLLAASQHGVARIAFVGDDGQLDAALSGIAQQVSPRILRAPARLEKVRTQLGEYFAGTRRDFDVPLDLAMATGAFRREVLAALPSVAYGATASYGDIARATGRPTAVRAVGTACALNPLPLVIPCHRVIRSDGSPGSYAGGPEAKRRLLDLESAA
jgi:methylated-DNA-[protein]-cysteine S-methyltransferase